MATAESKCSALTTSADLQGDHGIPFFFLFLMCSDFISWWLTQTQTGVSCVMFGPLRPWAKQPSSAPSCGSGDQHPASARVWTARRGWDGVQCCSLRHFWPHSHPCHSCTCLLAAVRHPADFWSSLNEDNRPPTPEPEWGFAMQRPTDIQATTNHRDRAPNAVAFIWHLGWWAVTLDHGIPDQ